MLKGVVITERDLAEPGEEIEAYSPEWEVEDTEIGLSRRYISRMKRALGEEVTAEGRPEEVGESEAGLSWDEFLRAEDLEDVRNLITPISLPAGYRVSKIAPPRGKTWKNVKDAIKEGKKFALRIWIEELTTPPAPLRKERYVESEIPVAFGLLAVDPSTKIVRYIPVRLIGERVRRAKKVGGRGVRVKYLFPHKKKRGGILSEEEMERLKEEFGVVDIDAAYNEVETLRGKLDELVRQRQELELMLEKETDKKKKEKLRAQLEVVKEEIEEVRSRIAILLEKIEEAEEAKEMGEEEAWEEYITTLRERGELKARLLKEVLLEKAAEVISQLLSRKKLQKAWEFLWKAKKKDSDRRDDVEGAKRKLEEGLKALSEGNGLEALEDFAIARFYLFDHDSYTEPLVNAFDDLMDMAWSAYKGRKYSKERAREVAQRILRLIESPRGNRAEPPRRVDSPRDARLWEMAKRIVKDEYRDIEEDSERFWQVVSRIFTRMKLRLGGAREEAVEKIVEELQEEHGKLPAAGKGAKTAKEVERLKEKHLRSKES